MMKSFFRRIKYGEEVNNKDFLRNGKILLKELIASSFGKRNPIRDFSIKELQIATNNFYELNVIRNNWPYKLYKGFLGNRSVIIMKFEKEVEKEDTVKFSINNIVFASQTSHKNVLKLIGCCLKTEVPIIVFEWVGYGTLHDHIFGYHDQDRFKALVWRDRLKIAMEIANAVAYLHVGFSRPIIHRNVTPYHILLDEQCAAKLFDFSFSEIIPEGKTYIFTIVCGTRGFIPPECIGTDLNEKCDVYGFGGLLLMLFTGKKIFCPNPKDENESGHLGFYVKEYYQENKLNEIVDPIIVRDKIFPDKDQQLLAFAELALKCISESVEDRPTMVEVAKQLRQMYKSSISVP